MKIKISKTKRSNSTLSIRQILQSQSVGSPPQKYSQDSDSKLEPVQIVSVSTRIKIELSLVVLMRIIYWTSMIIESTSNWSEQSDLKRFGTIIGVVGLNTHILGALIQPFKYYSDFRRRVSPEEPQVITGKLTDSSQSITWKVGEMKLYRHVHNMMNIMDEFQKRSLKFIIAPKQFQWPYRILPYRTIICDTASKSRYFEILTPCCALYASKFLSSIFPFLLSLGDTFDYGYALANFAAALRESYLLRDIELKLNLEGFSYYYRAYNDFPPTCIGRQMTRAIICRPNNSNLKEIISYIDKGEALIKKVKKNIIFKDNSRIEKNLKEFEYLISRSEDAEILDHKASVQDKAKSKFKKLNYDVQPVSVRQNSSLVATTKSYLRVTQFLLAKYGIFKRPALYAGALVSGFLTGGLGLGSLAVMGASASGGLLASTIVDNCCNSRTMSKSNRS